MSHSARAAKSSLLVLAILDASGDVESLPRIKATSGAEIDPHIGFETLEAANYYIEQRVTERDAEVRPLKDLIEEGKLGDNSPLLIFRSIQEIVDAYQNWEAWDAHTRIVTPATRKVFCRET